MPAMLSADSLFHERQFGLLLHPTSLPGPYGIGDLGPEARAFVRFLQSAGARLWQVLPLCPPGGDEQIVPYVSWAALAKNPLLISLDDLVCDGLLEQDELASAELPEGWLHHDALLAKKKRLLERAADRLIAGHQPAGLARLPDHQLAGLARLPDHQLAGLARLPDHQLAGLARLPDHRLGTQLASWARDAEWAHQAALFRALQIENDGRPWWQWPEMLRRCEQRALTSACDRLSRLISRELALQFLFERQWAALRRYAKERDVRILGDLPIYVWPDSVDVWAHRKNFRISADGQLDARGGCPPDEFTDEGQIWGGALYNWQTMKKRDYAWWQARIKRALAHFDGVRLDHFRAFVAHWEIPADASSARDGCWVAGPGQSLFDALKKALGPLPLCVEDLGAIDDDVIALRDGLGLPGMRILHYAFDGNGKNPHLPHNHPKAALVYPGNHDNDTTLGWWHKLSMQRRSLAQHYLQRHGDDIVWDLNRAALASVANVAVIAVQDVLALDGDARFNDPDSYRRLPPKERPNWRWRLTSEQLQPIHADRLRFFASLYGRLSE